MSGAEPTGGRHRLGLPRGMRLRDTRDFARVKQRGGRLVRGCLITNWLLAEGRGSSRLGVVVGRKVGGAVERNRAKRLLREAFRLHQEDLRGPVVLVLIGRPSIVGKRLADVEKDFVEAMRAARLLKDR